MISRMILGNGHSQRTCVFSQGNPRGRVESLDRANYEDHDLTSFQSNDTHTNAG
jgi:hypothetical protein